MRHIPGLLGYLITESGDVYSIRPRNGRGGFTEKPKRLAQRLDKDGYYRVSVRRNSKLVNIGIHQLLLITFVGPRPDGKVCRHLNDIKTDNRLENLCWGTPKENGEDAVRNGSSLKGEKHHKAKLTTNQVLQIYQRVSAGEDYDTLSSEFNISGQTVSAIFRGEVWSHVTGAKRWTKVDRPICINGHQRTPTTTKRIYRRTRDDWITVCLLCLQDKAVRIKQRRLK